MLLALFVLAMTIKFAKANQLNAIDSTCCGKIPTERMDRTILDSKSFKLKDMNLNKLGPHPVDYLDQPCTCEMGLTRYKKMYELKQFDNLENPKIYHACWKNNMAAVMRMCLKMPMPHPDMLQKFEKWFKNEIMPNEIEPMLSEFDYCHHAWFNHLTRKKQEEVKHYYDLGDGKIPIIPTIENLDEYNTYTNFVKSEKQFGPEPKTRCICSPGSGYKFIMGPVTHALEQHFKKSFKGYNVPENWEAMEYELDRLENIGLDNTVQLDGKSFDMCQHVYIKRIVDHTIYKHILHKIHHVNQELFIAVATAEMRTVKPTCVVNGKCIDYGSMTIWGQVFSGSMDTTLMNTIRMSLYVRFAAHIAKLDYEVVVWVKGDDTSVFMKLINVTIYTEALKQVFCTEQAWIDDPNIAHGLGQIAKFIKVGRIIDFDFCSTMAIKTQQGYKILRKLENIVNKEHLSVKVEQVGVDRYNNDLLTSAQKWLGSEETILSKYFALVHPYTPGLEPINKYGKERLELPSKFQYEYRLLHWDYEMEKEKFSRRSFTDIELYSNILEMVDNEQLLKFYETLHFRVLEDTILNNTL